MDAKIDALLMAVTRLSEPESSGMSSCLRELPDADRLPSPWETWTILNLIRHHKRQRWVADIVRTRLRGSLSELAKHGALGHAEGIPQSGPVPGLPEWEYYFHGRGCCISHKVDGDRIDVDFFDDSADYFDPFFYENYLKSLRRAEPPEQRLRELHPSAAALTIAITDLLAAGALMPLAGRDSHAYRLADELIDRSGEFESFCSAWADPKRRLWLAALVGDWLAADEAAAGQPELTAVTGPRAAACREIRRQRLHHDSENQFARADALYAMADLRACDLDESLDLALRGTPSGLTSSALDILGATADSRWCARVYELFCRVDPNGPIPQPHIWMASLKFLLRHGYRNSEVIASLAKAGGTEIGDAVLLALEHAPQLALPLIRKALLSEIPMDRTTVAAVLALIDAPWSRQELLRALGASDDQEKTADVRAALWESGEEGIQRAVLLWEERNPHEDEVGTYLEIDGRKRGPFYTFGEISLRDRASRIRYEMDKLHDRVMKVQHVIPPEPPRQRPWYMFWRR